MYEKQKGIERNLSSKFVSSVGNFFFHPLYTLLHRMKTANVWKHNRTLVILLVLSCF